MRLNDSNETPLDFISSYTLATIYSLQFKVNVLFVFGHYSHFTLNCILFLVYGFDYNQVEFCLIISI